MRKQTVKEKHPGEHRYVTQMNGGRPYVVYTGESDITVYTVPDKILSECRGWPEDKDLYTKLVKKIGNVTRKFIPKYKIVRNFNATGNTMLVQSGSGYVHVGDGIFSFKPEVGDEIQKYYSPIGNSNVPYPIAVGKTHVYIMLEKVLVKKDLFPKGIDWEEGAVNYYYKNFSGNKKDVKDLSGLKIIAKSSL